MEKSPKQFQGYRLQFWFESSGIKIVGELVLCFTFNFCLQYIIVERMFKKVPSVFVLGVREEEFALP